jgi:hypothetical protein
LMDSSLIQHFSFLQLGFPSLTLRSKTLLQALFIDLSLIVDLLELLLQIHPSGQMNPLLTSSTHPLTSLLSYPSNAGTLEISIALRLLNEWDAYSNEWILPLIFDKHLLFCYSSDRFILPLALLS